MPFSASLDEHYWLVATLHGRHTEHTQETGQRMAGYDACGKQDVMRGAQPGGPEPWAEGSAAAG